MSQLLGPSLKGGGGSRIKQNFLPPDGE